MSQSVTGGFGEQALERIIASDSYVQGKVLGVYYVEEVRYVSGPVGSRTSHTGLLSVAERWENDGSVRNISIRGVCPSMYVKVYVPELNESVLVSMSASDVVAFGEGSLRGKFTVTREEVSVKIDSSSVRFEEFGKFARADDVKRRQLKSYSSWNSSRGYVSFSDYSYKCGADIDRRLREAWARDVGIFSSEWRVEDVRDPEYSSSVELTVVPTVSGVEGSLRFSLSMNEWDENASLRAMIEQDGDGLASNLEYENVFVSLKEYERKGVVSEDGPWKLYRQSDKPNVFVRIAERFF